MTPLDIQRLADRRAIDRDAQRASGGVLENFPWGIRPVLYEGSVMDTPVLAERRELLDPVYGMMPVAGISAFHGSPHLFNKFRMDKIGTGEGAQAYGHGLYFAENPKVAKEYMRPEQNYQRAAGHLNNRQEFVKDMMDQGRTKDDIWKMTQEKYGEFVNPRELSLDFKSIWEEPATLYKVDIPDEQVAKMLDWDKPLSEQPKSVMDAVDKILPKSKRDSLAMRGLFGRDDYTKFHTGKTIAKPLGELTGKEIQVGLRSEIRSAFGSDAQNYREALGDADKFLKAVAGREKNSDSLTSAVLKREGIPGIKYLDQGSRGAGQGTRNFVLFDDQIPQILEVNDKPVRGILSGR